MKRSDNFPNLFDFINTFSIWVVLGSFTTYSYFALVYGFQPDFQAGVILALSIWVIYTVDHLLDGYKLKGKAMAKRHQQHYQLRGWLMVLVALSSLAAIILVFTHLDRNYFTFGFLLLGLTVMHFLINATISNKTKNRIFLKEVFIALVVTLGFAGLPLAINPSQIDSSLIPIIASFFFINLANLLLFSYFDYESDERSNFLSAAHIYGKDVSRNVAMVLLILSIGIQIYLGAIQGLSLAVWLTPISMAGTLLLLVFVPSFFQVNDRYRFFGDLIYLYPAVVIPLL